MTLHPDFQKLLPLVMSALKKDNIKAAYIFGSACSEHFKNESDLDLLVEIDDSDPSRYSATWYELLFDLEDRTGRAIDLLTPSALDNVYFKQEVLETAVRLI